ncbi:hypothetical protein WICMUC_004520 [Wickerhamomyces mucosus]|uniref:BHLH domain-containing protein n=1 Tax=Wickerhamomyces mucosus TaxID=1378264 RepID=A0A9P8PGR6_9ASCO|nr:hypothetical protein WICMUC_004520 [Wickerhamomyces mucosus]
MSNGIDNHGPSTPPFLNIQSPDFKNFRSFVRSPSNPSFLNQTLSTSQYSDDSSSLSKNNQHQQQQLLTSTTPNNDQYLMNPETNKIIDQNSQISPSNFSNNEKFQLSDMDFESAYALLTKSPTFNSPPISNNFFNSLNSPRSNQLLSVQTSNNFLDHHNITELQDFLFRSKTPSPKPSPKFTSTTDFFKINNSPKFWKNNIENGTSPNSILDLESLINYFPKTNKEEQLLSVNETDALEKFLDSIIDEKKDHLNDKDDFHSNLVQQKNLQDEDHHEVTNELQPPLTLNNKNNNKVLTNNVNSQIQEKISVKGIKRDSINSSSDNEDELIKIKEETISQPQPKKQRKKRKNLLSEEEKKMNHITSEQRRRGLIKDAFEELVGLLPLEDNKKTKWKKSVILDYTALEIEKLIKTNEELKRLLKT